MEGVQGCVLSGLYSRYLPGYDQSKQGLYPVTSLYYRTKHTSEGVPVRSKRVGVDVREDCEEGCPLQSRGAEGGAIEGMERVPPPSPFFPYRGR